MAETLSDFDRGYNAGLEAASTYHEQRAAAADKVIVAAHGLGDETFDKELKLHAIKVMLFHRDYRNVFWKMRRRTDAELAYEEKMEERFG